MTSNHEAMKSNNGLWDAGCWYTAAHGWCQFTLSDYLRDGVDSQLSVDAWVLYSYVIQIANYATI
jgi:hypothetical protein